MNKMKTIWILILTMMSSIILPSCLEDEDNLQTNMFPNALVTLKHDVTDGTLYMQLDDSTKLIPTNHQKSPYGDKEVRAFVNFTQETTSSRNQTYDVHVNWIDSIRTKNMDINLGEAANTMTYGNDPLEIVNHWATVVEDGYLTLRFRTFFGSGDVHYIRLVKGEDPYEVILYHDAGNDSNNQTSAADGYIAFRLNDLPDTKGETVDLILKWNSFSGEKTATFKYRSRNEQ